MRQPLAQPITIDFNKTWVVHPERGLVLLGVAKAFTVKSPLSLDARTGELSVALPTAAAPAPPSPTKDLTYFRQVGISPLDRLYLAGHTNCGNPSMATLSFSIENIRALPILLNRGGRLDRVAINVSTAGGTGCKARLAIYKAASETDLYPRELILDGGEVAADSVGFKSIAVNLTLLPNVIYWMVLNIGPTGVAAPTIKSIGVANMYPLLGIDNTMTVNTAGVGLIVATAYPSGWSYPAVFPPNATAITSTAPAMAYHAAE